MAELCPFDTTPLAVPRFINNLPIYNLNYTNQDYHSIKFKLLELLKTNFGEEFNDINESSLALVLIECWAAIADMLSFKIDQVANELFIDTVTELENAFRLSKLVGFRPLPPLPAKAMFLAKINSIYSGDLVLRTPVVLDLTNSGYDIVYELYQADTNNNPVFNTDIIIPAGNTFTDTIVGLEGRTRSYIFTSSGKANQIFSLPFENVFFGSIKITINDSLWQEVDNFTESTPKQEYKIEYNSYYKPSIIFGDNKTGLIPPPGTSINVKFRIPNSLTAEIISGTFDEKIFAEVPGVSTSVVVNIKNYTKSEYGYPGDKLGDIKSKLPQYLRTQNRAVTGADYKYIIDSFATPYDGAIGKSNIVLRNHGCAGNIIDVVMLAKTGDHRLVKANNNLKNSLIEELNNKKIFTDYICVRDGAVILTDINIDAHMNVAYKKHENEIRTKITEYLDEYFSLPNWEFGKYLKEKDLIKILSSVKEVKQFDISFTTNTGIESNMGNADLISAKYNEIIRPDNISVNFIYRAMGEE